jgi:hypothetical protein
MKEQKINFYISEQRLTTYRKHAKQDFNKALLLYQYNMQLSESFYSVLSLVEVVLRNAINESLKVYFKDTYWFSTSLPIEFEQAVLEAISKLNRRNASISPDRIIAELHFGFWSKLFNRNHSILLWKPLRLIFKNLPKNQKKREYIASVLNTIRLLRNRIYHYEPIFNDVAALEKQRKEIYLLQSITTVQSLPASIWYLAAKLP